MKKLLLSVVLFVSVFSAFCQLPETYTSSEILLRLKKLHVYGSVLYIAAHPDDENTRLLAYLAKGRLYKTGYLSLTRGDGGQNLIGEEQGSELGLIRTQELLAARKLDGAEQFFTRAYDFGFCKTTDEALATWGKEEILSDVVRVIRKFQPDIIITRFPPDSRAGHGHHSASAVLAQEAFAAAADAARFPEQLQDGLHPWQAKRLLWNTFNFGSTNTQSEDQFKIEVGGFNALLGKSYGEIAAESRSQHKSQGFGIAAQRGNAYEYFITSGGPAPENDLMDGIDTTVARTGIAKNSVHTIQQLTDSIIHSFAHESPEKSVPGLVRLYSMLTQQAGAAHWMKQKAAEVYKLIEICSGIYFEATADVPYVAAGDSLQIQVAVVNRGHLRINAASSNYTDDLPSPLPVNQVITSRRKIFIPVNEKISQPYWLEEGRNEGRFIVNKPELIGLPEAPPAYRVTLNIEIGNRFFIFTKPVMYKYTDPVDGEVYQPLVITPAVSLHQTPGLVFTRLNKQAPSQIRLNVTALTPLENARAAYHQFQYDRQKLVTNPVKEDTALTLQKNQVKTYTIDTEALLKNTREKDLRFFADLRTPYKERSQSYTIRRISYKHIPTITYFYINKVQVVDEPVATVGRKIGYIPGAGDYIPEALKLMHYDVVPLTEKEVLSGNLSQYDAIVTGIRAYNIHEWLGTAYDSLMKYVYDGGNLVVQYNTSSSLGPLKSRMGPYDFNISRARVTDENAEMKIVAPRHDILNWPNKITPLDFKDWTQERGLYFAADYAKEFTAPFTAADAGESQHAGSLITANYGKGRFTYTGISFFRQLPIGKGYRLFANIVANPKYKK